MAVTPEQLAELHARLDILEQQVEDHDRERLAVAEVNRRLDLMHRISQTPFIASIILMVGETRFYASRTYRLPHLPVEGMRLEATEKPLRTFRIAEVTLHARGVVSGRLNSVGIDASVLDELEACGWRVSSDDSESEAELASILGGGL